MAQPALYAKADNGRKPWYIVAIRSGISTGSPIHDFRIVKSVDDQSKALKELREKYGLSDCQVYIAEGYFNIQG